MAREKKGGARITLKPGPQVRRYPRTSAPVSIPSLLRKQEEQNGREKKWKRLVIWSKWRKEESGTRPVWTQHQACSPCGSYLGLYPLKLPFDTASEHSDKNPSVTGYADSKF